MDDNGSLPAPPPPVSAAPSSAIELLGDPPAGVHHRIHWTLEEGGGIRADFVCSAPDTEICRSHCSADQCEQIPCPHTVVAGPGRCLFADWFNASGDEPAEFYQGDNTQPRDGFVVPDWQGDYYTWTYAEEGSNG